MSSNKAGGSLLHRLLYAVFRFFPLSERKKLVLALNLNWTTYHLSQDFARKVFPFDKHPKRIKTLTFLKKHLKKSHKVLDLGCGAGQVSFMMAEIAGEVYGIDLDKPAIESAQDLMIRENLTFVYGDLLDFFASSNERFDVVVLSHVIGQIDDPVALLERISEFTDYIFIESDDFESNRLNNFRTEMPEAFSYTDENASRSHTRDSLGRDILNAGLTIGDADYRHGVLRYWCKTQE